MTAGARVDLDDGWRVGEDKQLVFTITDDQGIALDPTGWACTYRLWPARAPHGATPLVVIEVVGFAAKITVNVPATATAVLQPGTYEHSLWRTDVGLVSCLAADTVELGGSV